MPKSSPPRPLRRKRNIPVRRWLRALHRDAGYLIVGLTFVYALSGLAVNHIGDWDPNFTPVDITTPLEVKSLTVDPERPDLNLDAGRKLLIELGRDAEAERLEQADVYALDNSSFELTTENTTLYVDLDENQVREEGQSPRLLLRIANWLHLNRGKRAWTYVADTYAVLLLYLAGSGLFMFSGRRGIFGRAGVLALLGAAIPVGYVLLSGGP